MASTINGSAQSGHGDIDDLCAKLSALSVGIPVLERYAQQDQLVRRYVDILSPVLREVYNIIYRQNYEKHRLMGSGSPASIPHGSFIHELDQHYKNYVVPTGNHPTGHPPSAVHSVQHPVSLGHPPTGPEHSSPLTSSRYYLNYNDYP